LFQDILEVTAMFSEDIFEMTNSLGLLNLHFIIIVTGVQDRCDCKSCLKEKHRFIHLAHRLFDRFNNTKYFICIYNKTEHENIYCISTNFKSNIYYREHLSSNLNICKVTLPISMEQRSSWEGGIYYAAHTIFCFLWHHKSSLSCPKKWHTKGERIKVWYCF
jgi:hypothetical protein